MTARRSRGRRSAPPVAAATIEPARTLFRWGPVLAAAVVLLATAAVYSNSGSGPFVFDDQASILHNPTIRDLTDLSAVLSPPGEGFTVDGRPILNLSLAINYAIGGTGTASYHAFNVVIHALAALTLFGIVRRTLGREKPGATTVSPRAATALAFAVSLVWAIHPLQTESVTYVIQRAESLMGLFYLLTLYGFIRAVDRDREPMALGWSALSLVACLLGMGTKEVMVSAPLVVFLYDGVFVAEGWRAAWRRRWRYYLPLALTTGVLLALALRTGSRGGTSGFGLAVTPWMYWPTQFQAVTHYLRLCIWPSPLIFDCGIRWTGGFSDVIAHALGVGALVAGVAAALWRRHPAGFLGAVFFAILAPTSIIPGNRQTLAEHRMYLPLAAVVAFTVIGVFKSVPPARRKLLGAVGWVALVFVALPLAVLTFRRNEVYRTELSLYGDTVLHRPDNASAHTNLGNALRDARRYGEAIVEYRAAIRLRPFYPQAHYDLAGALSASDQVPQAIAEYEEALRQKPDYAEAHNNLGIALARTGRDAAALGHCAEAVRLDPANVEAHFNLGLVLMRMGRLAEAMDQFDKTLRLDAGFYRAHEAMGYALQMAGRGREGSAELETAARLRSAVR